MLFNTLLSLFLVITPLFGKTTDFKESFILYGLILAFAIASLFRRPAYRLSKKLVIFEASLLILFIISTIFSKNIGFSYYNFFRFLFSFLLLNLALCHLKSEKLSKYIFFSSLIYSLIFIFDKLKIIHLPTLAFYDNFILQIWGHSYLADLIIMVIPLTFYQFFKNSLFRKKNKFFTLISLIFFIGIIFLTNSRSTITALLLGIIFLFLPKINKKYNLGVFILLAALTASLVNNLFYKESSTLKSQYGNRFEYWREALLGFRDSPLLGNGPSNFFYLNKKYQNTASTNTNYAHSFLFESLALNGLPYTLIFFFLIISSLKFQYRSRPLNFYLGFVCLANALLDPAWNSLGIFCLSFFFIFEKNPHLLTVNSLSSSSKLFNIFNLFLIFLSLFYYLTKSTADILYIRGNPAASFRFDPFNLDNSLSLKDPYQKFILAIYPNDVFLYQKLIQNTALPDNETYYYKLFSLSPKENITQYTDLASYYFQTKQHQKLLYLLSLTKNNLHISNFSQKETIPLAKIYYQIALFQWKNKQYSAALVNFQDALDFSQNWGSFHIELANAYWALDKKDLALKQLQVECAQNSDSDKFCQEYLKRNRLTLLPAPGHMESYILTLDPNYLTISDQSLKDITEYRQIINQNPLPQSEDYFYKIFSLDPRNNSDLYYQLAKYYFDQKKYSQFEELFQIIDRNIVPQHNLIDNLLPLAKISYQYSLIKWHQQQFDSAIKYLQHAVSLSRSISYFHAELANAYWTLGKKDLALTELNDHCQTWPLSFASCQNYLKKHRYSFPPPGTSNMVQKIDSFTAYQKEEL